jgi:hypothetical protein
MTAGASAEPVGTTLPPGNVVITLALPLTARLEIAHDEQRRPRSSRTTPARPSTISA